MFFAQLRDHAHRQIGGLRRQVLGERDPRSLSGQRGVTDVGEREIEPAQFGFVLGVAREVVQLLERRRVGVQADDRQHHRLVIGADGGPIVHERAEAPLRLGNHAGIAPETEVLQRRAPQALNGRCLGGLRVPPEAVGHRLQHRASVLCKGVVARGAALVIFNRSQNIRHLFPSAHVEV